MPSLVLVGCGHSHLFVLEALARGRFPAARVVLVSEAEEYFYSGMVPGILAGAYQPADARFLPARLARAAGAEWVHARVERVDARERVVHLADGRELRYDLLSLDVGAAMAGSDVPGVREHAIPAKPMHFTLSLPPRIAEGRRPVRLVVAGGGAAGTEVSLCLSARHPRTELAITLVQPGGEILAEHPPANRRRASSLLASRGVEIRAGVRVAEVDEARVRCDSGEEIPFDLLLWATGPAAPPLVRASGLPADDRGFLRVGRELQVEGVAGVFAAGDCVSIDGEPWVPKAGVYAVREGPVLAHNLAASLRGEPLRGYEPQRSWLSLLNTGDGRALLAYRGVGARGRAAWWLKDRIDRRFMRRFQRIGEAPG